MFPMPTAIHLFSCSAKFLGSHWRLARLGLKHRVETVLRAWPSEKSRKRFPCKFIVPVSPVRFGGDSWRIAAIKRFLEGLQQVFSANLECVAEGEGFEPPVPFRVQRFSRPPVSTAHASLRKLTACCGTTYSSALVTERPLLQHRE